MDKWGDVPLLYALWSNASSEVIELLVKSYKSAHPDYKFDWSGMIHTLVKRHVPKANIEKLVETHQNNFPNQEYNMQGLVMELATYDTSHWDSNSNSCTHQDTFDYLLHVSISKPLDALAISRWRVDVEDSANAFFKGGSQRERETKSLYAKLATYESIKEGTSVLELALWKAKIDESRNKRARIDEVSYRDRCRVNCRADIIIKNVLPYLLPK